MELSLFGKWIKSNDIYLSFKKLIFNLRNLERPDVPVFSANAHSSIINAIDGCGGLKVGIGAPELVTCGRDGLVKVWDIRQKAPVAIMEPEEGHAKKDCWTVSFGTNSFLSYYSLL